jgi:hypothetical protein
MHSIKYSLPYLQNPAIGDHLNPDELSDIFISYVFRIRFIDIIQFYISSFPRNYSPVGDKEPLSTFKEADGIKISNHYRLKA